MFPWSKVENARHPETKHGDSATSRSANWENNWLKHKPRRGHDVSEASQPDGNTHEDGIGMLNLALHKDGDGDEDDNNSEDSKCSRMAQHHIQFHNFKPYALKSCPELHQLPFDCFEPLGFKVSRRALHVQAIRINTGSRIFATVDRLCVMTDQQSLLTRRDTQCGKQCPGAYVRLEDDFASLLHVTLFVLISQPPQRVRNDDFLLGNPPIFTPLLAQRHHCSIHPSQAVLQHLQGRAA